MAHDSSSQSGMTLKSEQLGAYLAKIGVNQPASLDNDSPSNFIGRSHDLYLGGTGCFHRMAVLDRASRCLHENG